MTAAKRARLPRGADGGTGGIPDRADALVYGANFSFGDARTTGGGLARARGKSQNPRRYLSIWLYGCLLDARKGRAKRRQKGIGRGLMLGVYRFGRGWPHSGHLVIPTMFAGYSVPQFSHWMMD